MEIDSSTSIRQTTIAIVNFLPNFSTAKTAHWLDQQTRGDPCQNSESLISLPHLIKLQLTTSSCSCKLTLYNLGLWRLPAWESSDILHDTMDRIWHRRSNIPGKALDLEVIRRLFSKDRHRSILGNHQEMVSPGSPFGTVPITRILAGGFFSIQMLEMAIERMQTVRGPNART